MNFFRKEVHAAVVAALSDVASWEQGLSIAPYGVLNFSEE